MIATSRLPKACALALAVVAHGALALALVATETALIEGSQGASDVRLGNAFADMAAGTLSAEPADTAAQPAQAEQAAPQKAQNSPRETLTPERATPPQPERAETAEPDRATVQDPAAPDATAQTARPALSDRLAAVPARDAIRQDDPAPALAPDRPEPAKPQEPPDSIAATDAEAGVVARSVRPQMRSPAFEAANRPPPAAPAQARRTPQSQPAPRGNADRNATAGQAGGTEQATASTSGSAGRQNAAGNAAASNYRGLVLGKIQRVGRPNVSARAKALVEFTISDTGGLSNIRLARRSGNAGLDKAAVHIVRSAAPFPPPPSGARRTWNVEIEGR